MLIYRVSKSLPTFCCTQFGEADTIIYLSTIMNSDFWNLTSLYEARNYQRLVASVTIMESLPIKDWAKGGELLLTSSKTLPTAEADITSLFHDMCTLSTAALAVKCKHNDANNISIKRLTAMAEVHQIPLFLIPEDKTYLSLTNGINALLSQVEQRDTLKEYILRYMLLSKNMQEDVIIHHCMQSLQVNFFEQQIQVFEFHLQNEQYVDERAYETQLQMIFLTVYALFEQLKRNDMLHDYLYMRSVKAIHIVISMQKEMEHIVTKLHTELRNFENLYIGISTVHTISHLKTLFEEAVFARKTGYALQNQRITTYPQVHLLRTIYNLHKLDQTAYFHKSIVPLIQHPFLIDTLLKYYRNNENQKATCKELFIHVNTLQYRLKKIETLTGLHLSNINDKMNLYVSLISFTMENWRNTHDYD